MRFFHKICISVLTASLCLSAFFAAPVHATEADPEAVSAAEAMPTDPAEASEYRYNMEIQSNTWEGWPTGPQIYAESAVVMEASTGTILYSKNIDAQHYPASITKIMTVLLALENCEMDEEVTFSHNAVYSIDYASSHIARDEGEILTVEECLYAIMLESANECSNAIAEHISGSVEAFAELMNQRAAELGCTNTHFTNANGLPDENHYTSAHDMALITREAIKHEKFRQISSAPRYTLRATNKKDEELLMNNHHYMISSYKTSKYLDDTVFAGKTGYTTVALNTLVTCATRSGMDLVVVTMKSQGTGEAGVPIYPDTANLLNYAGENFHKVNIAENETNFTIGQGELFDTGSSIFGNSAPMIEMNRDGYVILPVNAEFSSASPQLEFVDTKGSPILANLNYTYAGQYIGSTALYLTPTEVPDYEFQQTVQTPDGEAADTAVPEEVQPREPKKLIKINLRVVGIVIGALAVLLLIAFLVYRFSKDYKMDLNFIRKWRRRRADWNSFSNKRRRRYQSRRRRRNKWKFREK